MRSKTWDCICHHIGKCMDCESHWLNKHSGLFIEQSGLKVLHSKFHSEEYQQDLFKASEVTEECSIMIFAAVCSFVLLDYYYYVCRILWCSCKAGVKQICTV